MSNWPELSKTDKRLNVSKTHEEQGIDCYVSSVFADLLAQPNETSGLNSQILHGENVTLYAEQNGLSLVQSKLDHYVGWTKSANLKQGQLEATHWVTAPRTFLYPEPDMKAPRASLRGMGSKLQVIGEAETRGTHYIILKTGEAVIADHVSPLSTCASDYVCVAEQLVATPYLWGGATAYGIDCSGLVQLSMHMAGLEVLRDSDMQAASIGTPIECDKDFSNVKRGDLVFWRGHVGICQGLIDDQQFLVHANGHTMDVTSEPLLQAVERIEFLYEKPIGVRRPAKLCV